MGKLLDLVSRAVTARPWITLAVLAIVTVLLVAGIGQRAPQAENEAFLPQDSDVARAMAQIDELFGDSADVNLVTLVFRGETLTPDALAQMHALLGRIAADPQVGSLLPPTNPILAPTQVMAFLLETDDFASVPQAQIDATVEYLRTTPEAAQLYATLDALVGTDADGTPVGVAMVRVLETDGDASDDAQLRIEDLTQEAEGPLQVRSLSVPVIEEEVREATGTRMLPVMGIALLVVALLTLLFMRTLSDLLLTVSGLILAVLWTVGAEGWLGPDGFGAIGPPNALTSMVPLILISLTVDYSIQAVSHYREQRIAGEPVASAVRVGLRNVVIPLTLAAATTIVSFLTNLISPIGAIGDFGVVAGMGVGLSLIVMLTLIPAVRTIIDRRREARGTLPPVRPIANALPGIEQLAERLGASISRRPAPYIAFVAVASIGFGFATTDLTTNFSVRDILPRDGHALEDLETLDEAVGGSTEVVSVLVQAEISDTRTIQNLFDFTEAFKDERTRPRAAEGQVEASLAVLTDDWITNDGEGDLRYDPELEQLFNEATAGLHLDSALIQRFLDALGERDPVGLRHVLVNNPDGTDTALIQFRAFSGDPHETKGMHDDIRGLWYGGDDDITATSQDIITLAVADEIRDRQTEAIATTIAAALGILIIFFWVTLRQPALAFIAVAPIVLVLIWVLGTMALLGIPYTIVTSIITALSIGIGVDYTIHVIHRYREEFSRLRNPEKAAIRTLATTGSALLGSALTTALGFAVLTFSPLQSFAEFGITAAITIAYALIVSILVVPPAMTVWGAYQNMRLRSMVERLWDDLDVAIEDTHRRFDEGEESS
ncbi:MAG: MMPL family transporter [Chloroflexota bacterium]|nr:MMPL family transporter [Chloroflexota bacterium]